MTNLRPLLAPEDVSTILAISVKGIHELCRSGRLEYIRVNGKERRFTEEMVQAFIQEQTVSRPKKSVDRSRPLTLPCSRKGGVKSVEDSGTDLGKEIRDLCR